METRIDSLRQVEQVTVLGARWAMFFPINMLPQQQCSCGIQSLSHPSVRLRSLHPKDSQVAGLCCFGFSPDRSLDRLDSGGKWEVRNHGNGSKHIYCFVLFAGLFAAAGDEEGVPSLFLFFPVAVVDDFFSFGVPFSDGSLDLLGVLLTFFSVDFEGSLALVVFLASVSAFEGGLMSFFFFGSTFGFAPLSLVSVFGFEDLVEVDLASGE